MASPDLVSVHYDGPSGELRADGFEFVNGGVTTGVPRDVVLRIREVLPDHVLVIVDDLAPAPKAEPTTVPVKGKPTADAGEVASSVASDSAHLPEGDVPAEE